MRDPSKILAFIGEPALLEFLNADGTTAIRGDLVEKAGVTTQQDQYGKTEYVVALEFNSEGATIFEELTGAAYAEYLASNGARGSIPITLDGAVISDPAVRDGAISGGEAVISGNMTSEEANDLAIQIESGALPLDLDEIEVRSINASLGDDALSQSIFAGFIGICILFLFMIVYYRLPGIVACIALSIYLFIVVFLLAAIPAIQLTLPGIAGIILGIGMAVDANVIIFERFKEELALGKTLRSSLNSGFSKALRTIIDSNVTTFIAAAVIAFLGVGTVKGFGYTLMISIVTSMFTALVITRLLLKFIIYLKIKNRKLYTIRKQVSEFEAKGGE
jgi:preprotein translocase subunit SecD